MSSLIKVCIIIFWCSAVFSQRGRTSEVTPDRRYTCNETNKEGCDVTTFRKILVKGALYVVLLLIAVVILTAAFYTFKWFFYRRQRVILGYTYLAPIRELPIPEHPSHDLQVLHLARVHRSSENQPLVTDSESSDTSVSSSYKYSRKWKGTDVPKEMEQEV